MGRWITSVLIGVVIIAIGMAMPRTAQAGGVVGNGTPASCTEAAFNAALAGGGDVTFDCGGDSFTLVLTTEKTISTPTTIDGALNITLSGGGATSLFNVEGAGAQLTLRDITLSNGLASTGNGGAIRNSQILYTDNVLFYNNIASGAGGALYNSAVGSALLENTSFADNRAQAGGAIFNEADASVSLTEALILGNRVTGGGSYGGAVYNKGTFSQVGGMMGGNQIEGNGVFRAGGALYSESTGRTTLDGVEMKDNVAAVGGAVGGSGDFTLLNSTVTENTGEPILSFSEDTMRPHVRIVQSEISNNTGGALAVSDGDLLAIDRSTIARNNSADAAIYAVSVTTLTVENSTVANNSYGMKVEFSPAQSVQTFLNTTFVDNERYALTLANANATVKNTIFDESGLITPTPACIFTNGTLASLGFNLSSDASCSLTQTSDLPTTNPQLGPLGDNGGPTNTAMPARFGPPVDHGTLSGCPATDQRGIARPQGGSCDIGAVEWTEPMEEGVRVYLPLVRK